ncbi:MAG TPA: large conductance mechanosensitive channel protein MscL [Myxococcaceae bacterium]|jgi:large conductance mechanosensitive channel
MLKGFKQFMLRGNVIELAVAVAMGAAFGAVINALVKDMIMPLVTVVFGARDYSRLTFEVRGSTFQYGDLINAVLSFIFIGTTIYFLVIVPVNAIATRIRRGEKPPAPMTRKCPECLSDVPIAAKRCAHCTSPLPLPQQ